MEKQNTLPASVAREKLSYKMIDVGPKTETTRRALAQGKIQMSAHVLELIKSKQLPKGDPLALAEAAGIMAAKRTSDLLPLCHPLFLDAVRIESYIVNDTTIQITCEVRTTAKTGAEMEALMGVQVALLTIYDLVKGVDPALSILDVFLRTKEGGKSGHWVHPRVKMCDYEDRACHQHTKQALTNIKAAVLTVSDRRSNNTLPDESGTMILSFLKEQGATHLEPKIIADEQKQIQSAVREFVFEHSVDLIIITGGTGVGPRDVTPESVKVLFSKEIPGMGELLRQKGSAHTPMSWLSRSGAGIIEKTFVVFFPGSPKAVSEGLQAIKSLLPHALKMLRGGGHES
jgi:cyclic pyranopterin monophosphate synthase